MHQNNLDFQNGILLLRKAVKYIYIYIYHIYHYIVPCFDNFKEFLILYVAEQVQVRIYEANEKMVIT